MVAGDVIFVDVGVALGLGDLQLEHAAITTPRRLGAAKAALVSLSRRRFSVRSGLRRIMPIGCGKEHARFSRSDWNPH
jgi:hypothetical protein